MTCKKKYKNLDYEDYGYGMPKLAERMNDSIKGLVDNRCLAVKKRRCR